MFWIDTDKAIPAFDSQIVKVKVADFTRNYITYAHYNHKDHEWISKDGYSLGENVYAWKDISRKFKQK